ncbi:hypothetical protein [Methylorubrum extorquens]|uniref:Uncharacterized protein n=1 Tax=Methylorubrum extorquens TaxID=408 RepID=A0AAX3WBC2_METEX|nr:hypothetical protein [Methylorubrum extorquens]WHQ68627.1 hypothetical protein KEC54_19975 [Methylorubrum extorquens]
MTTSPVRFVATKAVREAVIGHEIEILQRIGIDWREGQSTHIDCPYLSHGGAKDWRATTTPRSSPC